MPIIHTTKTVNGKKVSRMSPTPDSRNLSRAKIRLKKALSKYPSSPEAVKKETKLKQLEKIKSRR